MDISGLKEQEKIINSIVSNTINRSLENHIIFFDFEDDYLAKSFFDKIYKRICEQSTSTLSIITDFDSKNHIDDASSKGVLDYIINSIQPNFSMNLGAVSAGIGFKHSTTNERKILTGCSDILFLIKHWDFLSGSNRNLITKMLINLKSYQSKYEKNIFIFIQFSLKQFNNFKKNIIDSNSFAYYNIKKLSLLESKAVIVDLLNISIDDDSYSNFFRLVDGKIIELINALKISDQPHFNEEIEKILDKLIEKINIEISKQHLNKCSYLELLSIMPNQFDPYDLIKIDHSIIEKDISDLIYILEKVSAIYHIDDRYYSLFAILRQKILLMNQSRKQLLYKAYYQYLENEYPSDYYRKIEILNELNVDDQYKLGVFCLAIENATNNIPEKDSIIECFNNSDFNLEISDLFKEICHHMKTSEDFSIFEYFTEKYCIFNPLLLSFLLKRDVLKKSQEYKPGDSLKSLCDQLYNIIVDNFDNNSTNYAEKTEKLHYIICSLILMPNYLDKFNNREKYNTLYKITHNIRSSNIYIQKEMLYFDNIMKRKSFYKCTAKEAIQNYNQALSYFVKIKDIDEIYMTLSGLIGLYLETNDLTRAKNAYNEIVILQKSHKNHLFPQYYKTINNYVLLKYLSEPKMDKNIINKYIQQLRQIIPACNSVAKCVVYTNICSLSLLIDNYDIYEKNKKNIENEINCDDISDIEDDSIDDFYRYYFAWFEFGKNIIQGKDSEARRIYKSLDNFIPEIFTIECSILRRKYRYYGDIFQDHIENGFTFSNYVIKKHKNNNIVWNFFAKGYMISDLQHTSIF